VPSFSSQLGFQLTPTTKRVLVALVALYIGQVAATMAGVDTYRLLAWGAGDFAPWQPLTAWLATRGDHLPPLFDWLGVAFGLPILERTLRRREMAAFLALVFGLTMALGLLLDRTGLLVVRSHAGLGLALMPIFILFGAAHRDAQLNLFFAIPIRGWHFAIGATAIGLLLQVLGSFPAGGVGIGALAAPWLWTAWFDPKNPIRRRLLKDRYDKLHHRLQVIEGGKSGKAGKPGKPLRWGGDNSQVH
jgi:hypothetical protein